jgi:hypothetical protein
MVLRRPRGRPPTRPELQRAYRARCQQLTRSGQPRKAPGATVPAATIAAWAERHAHRYHHGPGRPPHGSESLQVVVARHFGITVRTVQRALAQIRRERLRAAERAATDPILALLARAYAQQYRPVASTPAHGLKRTTTAVSPQTATASLHEAQSKTQQVVAATEAKRKSPLLPPQIDPQQWRAELAQALQQSDDLPWLQDLAAVLDARLGRPTRPHADEEALAAVGLRLTPRVARPSPPPSQETLTLEALREALDAFAAVHSLPQHTVIMAQFDAWARRPRRTPSA